MNKILTAIEALASSNPKKIAFIGQNNRGEHQSMSYLELLREVDINAHVFRAMKAKCIALKAENSLDWVVLDLAAMKAKVALVPVPTFFTAKQVEHTLRKSGADVLVGDWKSDKEAITSLRGLPVYMRQVNEKSDVIPQTCKITFTSGSTGDPKGVCLSTQNIERVAMALANSMEADRDTHLSLLPLSTLLENITSVYVPLLLGITARIYKPETLGLNGSSQLDFERFAHALAQFQPSSMVITPSILIALIQLAQINPELAKSLKFVAVGGARVAPELINNAHQHGIPAYEGYGLSELASVVCLNTVDNCKAGTSGRPLEHVEVKISADQELLVKGNIALGYIGEPYEDEWFATGDLASVDGDGYITIVGRKKNQIISGFGRNISPEWVESQAQVFAPGCPFILTGDAQASLTAIVANYLDIEHKIQRLNQSLPDYARIKNLFIVSDLDSRTHWFTSNGRPKRAVIESWVSCVHKQYISDPAVTLKTLNIQAEHKDSRRVI